MKKILPLLLIGCAKEEVPPPSIAGTIALQDEAHSADIKWDQAFIHHADGRMIAFVTGADGASCEKAASYLRDEDGPLEKDGILDPGGCVMTLVIDEWDGGFSGGWPDESQSYSPALSSNIRCDFGSGEYVLETRGGEYEDYYWSGLTWSGIPSVFKWTLDADLLEMKMSSYEGSLPYEAEIEMFPAIGIVEGSVETQRCDALADSPIF
jgi:hypothetical protein